MARHSTAEAFNAYRGGLLKFIRSKVRLLEDAEDIVQEVFYQFARVNDLARPVEQTAAWLYRAARNKIIDWYRKKRAIPFPVLETIDDDDAGDMPDVFDILSSEEETPETETLRALVWAEIESALDELPEAQRDIFIQTEFSDMPVKEIAEQTGVPVTTLLSRKHYAVVHLRKKLRALYTRLVR
jgi:RNA polymerase sigma factor (sigma-70 family)